MIFRQMEAAERGGGGQSVTRTASACSDRIAARSIDGPHGGGRGAYCMIYNITGMKSVSYVHAAPVLGLPNLYRVDTVFQETKSISRRTGHASC